MTDEELKALVASLAIAQKETDLQLRETDRQLKETDKQLKATDKQLKAQSLKLDEQIKETDKQIKATDKQVKATNKQLGGLAQKFGGFTEGMAFPAMTKILKDTFNMDVIATRIKVRKGGEEMELDVMAYANTTVNKVFIVEVKSLLREEGVHQIIQALTNFHRFFPEHSDKKVYGILASVDQTQQVKQYALKQGIYLAGIHDEQFIMETPTDFVPTAW